MNLPNYFFADLPQEATLSAAMISEACQTLRRNRETYLAGRPTGSLVKVLDDVARSWLTKDYPFRKRALEQGPAATGFSSVTLARGLDAFFTQVTRENLHALVEQDLGHPRRLDEITATESERKVGRAAVATAPELLAHFTAGNLPNPALSSIVLGVLLRSAQFVKCASGASLLPRLFAHSLYDAEPKLGACLEVAEWRGGNHEIEKILIDEADCVTAIGSDETLASIRQRVPARTRFVSYGHRVSFAFVAAKCRAGVVHAPLSRLPVPGIVSLAAADVTAWNQQGCLSPHVIYVQTGGALSPEHFAEELAGELARIEQSEPRGPLPATEAAAIASRRSIYQVRAAHSPETQLWCSQDTTAWTVVFEADPRFQISCLNRFIYVKPVKDLADALRNADPVCGKVSTVGLAAEEEERQQLATELARWGVIRVCPIGQMQNPPLTWRHDGRLALGELVTWTDYENET